MATVMLSAALFGANSNTMQASAINFSDVSASFWGHSNIQWAIENKVVDGYPDGSFKPNQNVEQAEFIAMLIRAINQVILSKKLTRIIGHYPILIMLVKWDGVLEPPHR